MGEELEIRTVEERPFWETINCKDIESIVLGNIYTQERATKTLINSAVAAGYYLRRQRDEKMYLEQGYDRFEDYVKDRYGKSLSWASRQIDMNEAFSIGGNDPRADEKWLEFGKSQLQEMLYLTDKQREQVTPGMTVKEIREIRKPEPAPVPEPEPIEEATVEVVICEAVELEPVIMDEAPAETVIVESSVEEMLPEVDEESHGPAKCITGQSDSGLCGGAAYCSEPYTCCAQCSNDCNGRCGWLEESSKADDHAQDQMEYAVAAMSDPKIDFKALDRMIESKKHDEAWFVGEWAKIFPERCKKIMDLIRGMENGEKAKAVQKYIAPCGYSSDSSRDNDCTFHGFTGGIDLRFGDEKIHLKYGRFVKELEELHRKKVATSQVITEENEDKQSNRNPIKISELVSEMSSAARNSLNNAQIAIGAKAWKAALADARHLVHYLEVIVRETEGVL